MLTFYIIDFLQMSSDQNGELKSEKPEETPLHVDTDMVDAGEEDLRYGWGNIRPKCLQFLNSPKCFVTALAFFSFIQGNQQHWHSLSLVQFITTIEPHYRPPWR